MNKLQEQALRKQIRKIIKEESKNSKIGKYYTFQYVPNKIVYVYDVSDGKIMFYAFFKEKGESEITAKPHSLSIKLGKNLKPIKSGTEIPQKIQKIVSSLGNVTESTSLKEEREEALFSKLTAAQSKLTKMNKEFLAKYKAEDDTDKKKKMIAPQKEKTKKLKDEISDLEKKINELTPA